MKGKASANPPRLAERRGAPGSVEDLAGSLFRTLQEPPRLHPAVEARIERRLEGSSVRRRTAVLRWPVFALAGITLFVTSGAVLAKFQPAPMRRLIAFVEDVVVRVSPPKARRAPAPTPARPAAHAPARPIITPVQSPAPAIVEEPVSEPAAVPPPAEPPRPRARVALKNPAPASKPAAVPAPAREAPPAAPPATALSAESRLLGKALAQLRQDRDPKAALATLNEYEAAHPRGVLALEASAARVDALLALGRRAEALGRLESIPLDGLGRATALRVLRGELRAAAGRTAAAAADFDGVWRQVGPEAGQGAGSHKAGDVAERALYGRASCRSQLKDEPGARADLELYLRLYPEGRFAAQARKALGR